MKSAVTVQTAFARFDDAKMGAAERASLLTSKLTFVMMNLLAMSGALYKMSLMGLLPNTPSDWVNFFGGAAECAVRVRLVMRGRDRMRLAACSRARRDARRLPTCTVERSESAAPGPWSVSVTSDELQHFIFFLERER